MSETGDGNETYSVMGRQRDAVHGSIAGGTFLRSVSRLCGEITLNHYEVNVGDIVLVQWNIHLPPAANDEDNHALEPSDLDWIGLFRTNDLNPDSLLSHRTRGSNLDNSGQISWTLSADYITEPTMQLCYCFYSNDNTLLAQSDTLTVNNPHLSLTIPVSVSGQPIDITITELSCFNLRMKTFGTPDSYVKLKVVPGTRQPKQPYHSQRLIVTSVYLSSLSPSWTEEFHLQAQPTDILELEVRDKFSISRPSASHFLGKARIDLSCITEQHSSSFSHQLQKRLPTDRVAGRIGLKIVNDHIPPVISSSSPPLTHQPVTPSDSDESVNEQYPPERADDRIRWVRRTLHDNSYRGNHRRHSSNRRHTLIERSHGRSHDQHVSLQQSLSVVERTSNESALTESLYPFTLSTEPQHNRLLVDQFVARASRNQLIRQHSVPVERNTNNQGLEPIPTLETSNRSLEPIPTLETSTQGLEPIPTLETSTQGLEPVSTSESSTQSLEPVPTPETSTQSLELVPTPETSTQSLDPVSVPSLTIENVDSPETSPVHIIVTGDVPVVTTNETTPSLIEDSNDTDNDGVVSSNDTLAATKSFNRMDSVDESLKNTPTFKFMTRPDLYEFVKSTGKTDILQNLTLLQLIQSIRSDHTLLSKYINSNKLITALNEFALTDHELPDGWERKVEISTGKAVFLDHENHMTTFIDPRLPYPGSNYKRVGDTKSGMMRNRPVYTAPQRSTSNPPPPQLTIEMRTQRSVTTPPTLDGTDFDNLLRELSNIEPEPEQPSYSQNVVNFLRQPDIHTILISRHEEPITDELRELIDRIINGGVTELELIQNQASDVFFELVVILSLFEEDIAHQLYNILDMPQHNSNDIPTTPTGATPTGTMLNRTDTSAAAVTPTGDTPSHRPQLVQTNDIPDYNYASGEYAGIPLNNIIEFFQLPSVYSHVLRNQGGIQPVHRMHIAEISGLFPHELSEMLVTNVAAKQFIYELRNEIRRSTNLDVDRPPTAQQVLNYMSQPNILEIIQNLTVIDPDERSIISVCGLWDVSLIDFELNRNSVLKYLVERLQPHIKAFFESSVLPPTVSLDNPMPPLTPRSRTSSSTSSDDTGSTDDTSTTSSISTRPESSDTPTSSGTSESPRPVTPGTPTPESGILTLGDNLPPPPSRPQATVHRKKNRDFVVKLQKLQSTLDDNHYASSNYSTKNFTLRRDHLLEDAYKLIMTASAKSLRARRCHVSWDKEEGLDYGGPQREFFFKLSRHLFNPYYGLFEYTSHGSYTVQISRYSNQVENCHQWFRFAGRVIGYSIIQNNLLDVFFARHVYKSLLGLPYVLSDVEDLDIAYYNSLKYVIENDPSPLELTFTVTEDSFGENVEKDLKPGGSTIPVTEDNKKHYVDLMIQWKLCKGIEKQTESLVEGFKEMLPIQYLQPFDARELEWVIAGTPEVDIEDWKKNTQYWGGYSATHNVIKWFWEVIESCADEEKLRFLQFATGTSSIPYEGFKALRGSSQQITKFTIDRYTGDIGALPIAHTCFNRIDLPPYLSLIEMREKLMFAILETDGFGNA